MAMVASAVYFVIHDDRLTLAISVMDIFLIRFEIGKNVCLDVVPQFDYFQQIFLTMSKRLMLISILME